MKELKDSGFFHFEEPVGLEKCRSHEPDLDVMHTFADFDQSGHHSIN